MLHSPARWPPYSRPGTSPLLKVGHYIFARPYKAALGRIRIIASGYRLYGGRGSQEFMGRSITRGPAALTWMCIEAHLSRCLVR
jgi:hypothetical protein